MSFDFEPAVTSPLATFGGGEASLADIWISARRAGLYAASMQAQGRAMEEAYARRVTAIREATGAVVENPALTAFSGMPSQEELTSMRPGENRYDAAKRKFQATLEKLADQFPDQAETIGAARPIEADALAISNEAETEAARISSSRTGLLKWGAMLGGGIDAFIRDPLNAYSLIIGGGPGAARSVGGRILAVTAREALINGAFEAAQQPLIQEWRQKAGLDAGIDVAIRNVLFAAGTGAAFGAAGQGVAEGVSAALARRAARLSAELAQDPRVTPLAREALAGDPRAAAEILAPIRKELPAEARGALDAAEDVSRLDAARPKAATPETHELAVSQAHRALDAGPSQPLIFEVDPDQVARIAEAIQPLAARPETPKAAGLTEFLAKAGGIDAAEPEIRGTDLSKITVPFKGRLAREGGMPLDRARELAAQNGYLWEFGSIDEATASTVPDDLVQLLARESRGEAVVPFEHVSATRDIAEFDSARRELEDMAHEVLAKAGPGLPDEKVVAAMEIMRDEGVDAETAVARIQGESPRAGDVPPGWSDEELLAASENRPAEPSAATVADTLAEPGELDFTPEQLAEWGNELIPGENGEQVPLSAYLDDLSRADDYANILEACKG